MIGTGAGSCESSSHGGIAVKVLVAGGTGFLGREIVAHALDAGHEVAVLSRSRPSTDPFGGRAAFRAGNVTDPRTLPAALEEIDVLVDAVQFPNSPVEDPKRGHTFERVDYGGTCNLVDASKAAGVRQYVDLSGVGAAEHAPYHWQRLKWRAEQHIRASGLACTIFRPSWVYGPRDVSLNRFLGFARWLPFVPVIGDGKTRINPLFVDDLAAHVVAALGNDAVAGRAFEIGGPQALTMDEVIRTALAVSGRRRFLLHQPKPLMKAVAGVLQHVPGRPLTPGAIDFITADGVADTGPLREAFGLELRPLEVALATYLVSGHES
jgi:NADH dehydrogenase